jgi:hypothetical protein
MGAVHMQKSHIVATLALAFLIVALLSVPTQLGASVRTTSSASAPLAALSAAPVYYSAPHASPAPAAVSFPRTVLIETFTGVWCIHCPAEAEALHSIDDLNNRSVVDIAELHVCAFAAGQGPCLDNYVPPDGTSDTRGTWYGVCGFPDVFFDGLYNACGATNSIPQMEAEYNASIANASAYPGNVSISQTATVDGGNVIQHGEIDSAITGTYNVVTYLLEYIGKLNVNVGYGPHDVDHVVRETLANHPVSLTAGESTAISATGAINSTWNELNFSVVTFVQQNSTMIVENANQAPVTTLTTAVASNTTSLFSNGAATVSIHVANSTTGDPLVGATVNLSVSGGGTVTPTGGVTDANGNLTVAYQAPTVTSSTNVVITAAVASAGYTAGTGTVTLTVNPILVPDIPTGVTITPSSQQVSLNWTIPGTGGAGVTYHVFRAAALAGPYSEIVAQFATSYADTTVLAGHSYWYKVSAQNTAGFSGNTSAISASSVTVLTQGLAPYTGWWITIDSTNFSAATNGSQLLYLPNGYFAYQYGPHSYAYLAPTATGSLNVAGSSVTITATFAPRYAGLKGTVSPADATVTVNGTAVTVSGGAFLDSLVAGTYVLNVSAVGYNSNASMVTLTPGNISSVTVQLTSAPGSTTSPSGTGGSGGLTGADWIVLAVGVVAVAAVIGGAMVFSGRGKRPSAPRNGASPSNRPPANEP